MSLIELKDLSKFYSKDGNVAMGLTKVNLELNIGEFVAITGESGSGKSTLLNVMSGLDTFEDGEYFFNGDKTSAYEQKDWDDFREKYVSFIFQDYNIIESYTVLQNVELALLYIEDVTERNKIAREIIEKVGLTKYIKHKGSKLSGGQKQRTVIARALAKNSPIIFADEPTGNLDSQSAKDIIELLHDISKDKLVVIVTHSYDEVADYITRHIRIFDGKIVEDKKLAHSETISFDKDTNQKTVSHKAKIATKLAKDNLLATPKKTLFVSSLFVFVIFAMMMLAGYFLGSSRVQQYVLRYHPENRIVVASQKSKYLTAEDMAKLQALNIGQVESLDKILDKNYDLIIDSEDHYNRINFAINFIDKPELDLGRLPSADNEIAIDMEKNWYSSKIILDCFNTGKSYKIHGNEYKVVGLKFNNDFNFNLYSTRQTAKILTALSEMSNYQSALHVSDNFIGDIDMVDTYIYDPTLKAGEVKVYSPKTYKKVEIYYGNVRYEFTADKIINVPNDSLKIAISPDFIDNQIYGNTKQVSIFLDDAGKAKSVMKQLDKMGYLALYPDEMIVPKELGQVIMDSLKILIWIVSSIALMSVLGVALNRIIMLKSQDLSIYRAIGLGKDVAKMSLHMEFSFLSVIPVILDTILISVLTYKVSAIGEFMINVHWYEYILIIIAVFVVINGLAYVFNKRLHEKAVRKTLRGAK